MDSVSKHNRPQSLFSGTQLPPYTAQGGNGVVSYPPLSNNGSKCDEKHVDMDEDDPAKSAPHALSGLGAQIEEVRRKWQVPEVLKKAWGWRKLNFFFYEIATILRFIQNLCLVPT